MRRRGQAIVEVLALAPLISALVVAFAVASDRIVEHARAERLREATRIAQLHGEPIPGPGRRGQVTVLVLAILLPVSVLATQLLAVLALRAAG